MTFTESLLQEMERESLTTRKMLERIPADQYDWKPHEKSMSLRQLATHVAEVPGWTPTVLNTTEMDFAKMDYNPHPVNSPADLIQYFETSLDKGKKALAAANDNQLLNETWTMRNGDTILAKDSKLDTLRGCFCQVVHHRAQLGVYLRLLNVPIPGSYGPSADDASF